MDPRYRNTHLKLLGTGSLSSLGISVIFRYFGMNKMLNSYPFLVSFFQIGEFNLSLGVLGPCYTLEIMLSLTLRYLRKSY